MSLKILVAGLSFCLGFNTLCPASVRYEGLVKDDAGNPLEFVNVTLRTLNDSTLIDGTVTDSTGKFTVYGFDAPLFLYISALGFDDTTINNPPAVVGEIVPLCLMMH